MNCVSTLAHPRDTITDVIAEVIFEVREPIGKNASMPRAAKKTAGKPKRYYRTKDARAFIGRIEIAARVALWNTRTWPRDPWIPLDVTVTTQIHDTRHDADAVHALVRDKIQGIFYHDDRIVRNGANEPPIMDGLGRRVVVTVVLNAVRSAEEADKLRTASEKRAVARLVNKSKTRKITITTKKRAM